MALHKRTDSTLIDCLSLLTVKWKFLPSVTVTAQSWAHNATHTATGNWIYIVKKNETVRLDKNPKYGGS